MSGSEWVSAPSPITYDSLYNGESFDGRRAAAVDGWSSPGFDASAWVGVRLADKTPASRAVRTPLPACARRDEGAGATDAAP